MLYFLLLLGTLAYSQSSKPIIDNDRVTVWDGQSFAAGTAELDTVRVQIELRKATFFKRGAAIPASDGKREVRIQIQDKLVPAQVDATKYPKAFPRPGSRKVLETDRSVTWAYQWTPKVPTPMHFHDKDVVVIYFDTGTLRSTTPDGDVTDNSYTPATVRFNLHNRTHRELLISGQQSAIMTELK